MIKRILKDGLNRLGYDLTSFGKRSSAMTMNAALWRSKNRGMRFQTIIDVGASDGRWSMDCMKCFPDSDYLLIEAQAPHQPALEQLCQKNHNMRYVMAAAGRSTGVIHFDNSSLFGGLASESPMTNSIEVPVVRIDDEVHKNKLKGPFLVKLDTHGYEVPILEGGINTIKNADLVIIECYNYQLTPDSLRYFEMCEYMRALGFLSIELVDFVLRTRDNSFWQMDIFFAPENRPEFQNNSFE